MIVKTKIGILYLASTFTGPILSMSSSERVETHILRILAKLYQLH